MANWFLDSGAGGSQNGTTVFNSWHSIERPLAGTSAFTGSGDTGGPVTTAGDIVFINPTHHETWTLSALSRVRYQGSNTPSNPVIYRADNAGVHFTASASRPRIQMNNTGNAYFDENATDQHLQFEGIGFDYGSADSALGSDFWQALTVTVRFINCTFGGGTSSTKFGGRFNCGGGGVIIFEDCDIDATQTDRTVGNAIYCTGGDFLIRRTIFDGWKWLTQGFNNQPQYVIFEDLDVLNRSVSGGSVFGGNATSGLMQIRGIRMNRDDFDPIVENITEQHPGSFVEILDFDDVPRSYLRDTPQGEIQSSEAAGDANRTGGSDHVFVVTPTSLCNDVMNGSNGMTLLEYPLIAEGGVAKTYTIHVKPTGWTTFPTSANLIFEIGYYDTASDDERTYTASTDSMTTTNGVWSTLTVPDIEPAESGSVIARVRLLTNDGGSGETLTFDFDDLFSEITVPLLYVPHAGI